MSSLQSLTFIILRGVGSYLALIVAAGALGWLALRLEAIPAVQVRPWEEGAAPLVVVDAGHGGHDGGAVAGGVIEKDLSLKLARQVREHLEKAGVRVRMTRDKDRFLELDERCQIVTETKADAFVSLHLNTSVSSDIDGVETYFSTASSLLRRRSGGLGVGRDGESLAKILQRYICNATGAADRGSRDSQLIVVMRTPCPAVLVECGFLTHADEARRLQQEEYQEKLTRSMADGLVEFLKVQPRARND